MNFLLTGLIRGNDTYDRCMNYIVDSLMSSVVKSVKEFYNIDEDIDLHSIIDTFIHGKITKIFNDSAKTSYRNKFAEFGKDAVKLTSTRKVTLIASLRSYFVKLRDIDTALKYCSVPDDLSEAKKKVDRATYVHGYTYYEDFRFNSLNMASYMNSTLEGIITKQDLSEDLPDVNRVDFLSDINDGSSNKREESYFENKKKHLYISRQQTMVQLNEDFVDEISRILSMMPNAQQLTHIIKLFSLDKKHSVNSLLLHKILLVLTGESKIYIKTLGKFNRLILTLMWIKMKSNPSLMKFSSIADVMLMKQTDISTTDDTSFSDLLIRHNFIDPKYQKIRNILVVYTDGSRQIVLDHDLVCEFIKFLEDGVALTHALFPERHVMDDSVRSIEHLFKSNLSKSEEKYKTSAFKYMSNKSVIGGL